MARSVLLVEDDARTRDRLATVIAAQPGLQLLAAAGNCTEARAALQVHIPDALLLDLGLPDGDGTDLIPEAVRAGARIIVLCVFDGPRQRAALAAGAHHCLLKDSSAGEIGRSIDTLFAQ